MNTWAVVRPVVLLVVGVFVIHQIGVWEGRIQQRERDHEQQYQAFLDQRARYSELQDSLLAVEDSLQLVDSLLVEEESRNNAIVMALDSTDDEEVVELADAEIERLLPPLRLSFSGFNETEPMYHTDSSGVRFLAGRMLRLSQVERRLTAVERLSDTRLTRISTLTRLSATATVRADSAEARLTTCEAIGAECEALRTQRTKWLGFIPKPPRLLVLAIGVGAGLLISR